jgi:hypothetical protein
LQQLKLAELYADPRITEARFPNVTTTPLRRRARLAVARDLKMGMPHFEIRDPNKYAARLRECTRSRRYESNHRVRTTLRKAADNAHVEPREGDLSKSRARREPVTAKLASGPYVHTINLRPVLERDPPYGYIHLHLTIFADCSCPRLLARTSFCDRTRTSAGRSSIRVCGCVDKPDGDQLVSRRSSVDGAIHAFPVCGGVCIKATLLRRCHCKMALQESFEISLRLSS